MSGQDHWTQINHLTPTLVLRNIYCVDMFKPNIVKKKDEQLSQTSKTNQLNLKHIQPCLVK
jgi:hypothetical protein